MTAGNTKKIVKSIYQLITDSELEKSNMKNNENNISISKNSSEKDNLSF